MMGGWDRWVGVGGWLIHIRVWVAGQGVGIISQFFFFIFFVLLSFALSCPVSFLSEQSMIAVVSVSLFIYLFFFCLWSL